jgi:hypothetical protein
MESFIHGYGSTMVGSILALVAISLFIYHQRKQMLASGLNAVDYINEVLLKDHAILVLVVLVFVNIAEAIYAASIPDTGIYINGISRFFTHFSIAFVAILMMLELPRTFMDTISNSAFLLDDKKVLKVEYWALFFIQLPMTIAVAVAAFGIPILNYFTIASGLHQLDIARYAVYESLDALIFFIDFGLPKYYVSEGLPLDYNPFNEMLYPLFAAYVMMLSHMLFSSYDGLYALKRKLTRITLGDPAHVGSGASGAEIAEIQRDPQNALKFLVNQAGNSRSRQRADQIAQEAYQKWAGLTDNNLKMDIVRQIATIYRRWKNFERDVNSGTMSTTVKQNKRRQLINQTREFFRKSPRNKGLGRPLSTRRMP